MAGGLTLDAIEELLDRKLHPIKARLDAIDARLDAMDARQRIMAAKQHNSLVGREDRLQVVPLESGVLPKSEFPQNLVQLMVAGSESRPQAGGGRVGWSKVKSQGLLLEYGESGYESDSADELSETARRARLQLARRIGITTSQINYAQMTL